MSMDSDDDGYNISYRANHENNHETVTKTNKRQNV